MSAHDMVIDEHILFYLEGSIDWAISNLKEGNRPKEEIIDALEDAMKNYLTELTPLWEIKSKTKKEIYAELALFSEKADAEEVVSHIRKIHLNNIERDNI